MPTFQVDTHLFRELGELLVGRDSTALVELIKNAYDADATSVSVEGQNLDDPSNGRIVITDTGIGMTRAVFEKGFLTIASRIKEEGDRRSFKYKRRFTGAKGVGRLAAHKLAKKMRVLSIPDAEVYPRSPTVEASIDWETIEKLKTFDEIEGAAAVKVNDLPRPADAQPGTWIELRKLRKKWTEAERARFFWEVQTFRPLDVFVNMPSEEFQTPLLFDAPRIADIKRRDPGFSVSLLGDLEAGEEYQQVLVQTASWLIEIDARKDTLQVEYLISPTRHCLKENPNAQPYHYTLKYPGEAEGPFFQARLLVRPGSPSGITRNVRSWLGRIAGVRVFMEGFRVLPYGEKGDDWLDLDADYKKRSRTLQYLEAYTFPGLGQEDEDEGLSGLGNDAYAGAIFLIQEAAGDLRMLVNREGFIPTAAFDTLKTIVRIGIDLSIRIHRAGRSDEREKWRTQRSGVPLKEPPSSTSRAANIRQTVEEQVTRATELARQARQEVVAGRIDKAAQLVENAAVELDSGAKNSDRLLTEPTMTRILAAIGTQMAAFVHEINGLLGVARSVERALERMRKASGLRAELRSSLAELHSQIGELRRSVERQAAYLTDITSPDARRRRSRQHLAERFDSAVRLIAPRAERSRIKIVNQIPASLTSIPMFPAELTLVFSNLLTNAVKAAGEGGKILASAGKAGSQLRIRVENTGIRVDLAEAERWFQPFESTTLQLDPYLGQGMGMGLPITRNVLDEYGAEIHFAPPSENYATALEITFPSGG